MILVLFCLLFFTHKKLYHSLQWLFSYGNRYCEQALRCDLPTGIAKAKNIPQKRRREIPT